MHASRILPVAIVDLNITNAGDTLIPGSTENHILIFIHELMHCYQEKIMPESYGNLDLNPGLNFALYSEIEGLSLAKAYQQDSKAT
ncbi:MAG: hypothetical protein PHY99_01990 [Bacteroidales bacterium]|nr:hypothetical protein [Bacteroidales bacterium]